VSAEKLSISLDSELAATVRAAAAEQGVSVSTWLADAAQAQVRQRRLREALDSLAAEIGGLDADEVDRLVAAARRNSSVVTGSRGAA
jgi:metal-responsive CopG/Arc/MetJ family transcriptional regulator